MLLGGIDVCCETFVASKPANQHFLSNLHSHNMTLTTRVGHQDKLLYTIIFSIDDKNVTVTIESHILWVS